MPTGFIEILVRPPRRRGRPRRREVTVTSRSGVRCVVSTGVPIELAAALLSTTLAWRRSRRGEPC